MTALSGAKSDPSSSISSLSVLYLHPCLPSGVTGVTLDCARPPCSRLVAGSRGAWRLGLQVRLNSASLEKSKQSGIQHNKTGGDGLLSDCGEKYHDCTMTSCSQGQGSTYTRLTCLSLIPLLHLHIKPYLGLSTNVFPLAFVYGMVQFRWEQSALQYIRYWYNLKRPGRMLPWQCDATGTRTSKLWQHLSVSIL